MRGFSGNMRFMHGFVREHRLTNDVADGEDVGHIGAHLRIHVDESAFVNRHTSMLRADEQSVGGTSHCDQHHVVALWLSRRGGCVVGFFKCDVDAVLTRLNCNGFGVGIDVVKAVGVVFLPNFNEVAIRALHQSVHHFDHIQACAE